MRFLGTKQNLSADAILRLPGFVRKVGGLGPSVIPRLRAASVDGSHGF